MIPTSAHARIIGKRFIGELLMDVGVGLAEL
jgi:hypothetical protein